MAAVDYWVRFGSDNPANHTGLSPTFIKFLNAAGAATTAPAITEPGSAGLYKFSYDPQGTIGFIIDGNPAGVSLFGSDRFVIGALDIADKVAETGISLIAAGNTLVAQGATVVNIGNLLVGLGNSFATVDAAITAQGVLIVGLGNTQTAQGAFIANIGATTASFGTDSTDPATLFGFMKRIQELQEGNSVYTKATGAWAIYSRGSSQLLRTKSISDSATTVDKT